MSSNIIREMLLRKGILYSIEKKADLFRSASVTSENDLFRIKLKKIFLDLCAWYLRGKEIDTACYLNKQDERTRAGFTLLGGPIIASDPGGIDFAYYYYGTYNKYSQTVYCLKYDSGDYSSSEISSLNTAFDNAHPGWTRVFSATKKYNCHSFAWINPVVYNDYWLDYPDAYANSSSFTHVNTNGSAATGDRIIIRGNVAQTVFYNYTTDALHSLIAVSNGTNSGAIRTESKLGRCGVYEASLMEMMAFYGGSSYDVYR